jgi:hypothetical protein
LDLNSSGEINSDLHFPAGPVCHGERGTSAAHRAPLPLWRRRLPYPCVQRRSCLATPPLPPSDVGLPELIGGLPSPAVSLAFISSLRVRPTAREEDGVGAADSLPLHARPPLSPCRRGGSRMDGDRAHDARFDASPRSGVDDGELELLFILLSMTARSGGARASGAVSPVLLPPAVSPVALWAGAAEWTTRGSLMCSSTHLAPPLLLQEAGAPPTPTPPLTPAPQGADFSALPPELVH